MIACALLVVLTATWVLPLGTAAAYHGPLRSDPDAVKTVAVLPLAQPNDPLVTAQGPLEVVSVKPDPELAAVYVAHVPPTYHAPLLIKQPVVPDEVATLRVPFPENGVPVGVVPPPLVVDVVVVVPPPPLVPLGRYLIPVAGQSDLEPSGLAGTKVPVETEPRVSKKYHTSSSAPEAH